MAAVMPVELKKVGGNTSCWVIFNGNAESSILEMDKHALMRRVEIHGRDLRLLDPLLSYPSTILGRDKAIVVNLEHIKAIITAEEVLLRDPLDENVIPIVKELQRRLSQALCDGQVDEDEQAGAHDDNHISDGYDFAFEFRALEVMLEGICSYLDARTTDLETAAYPALDELTSKISSRNLDRVRKLKSAMTRLTNRVQKVRDELEELLDDDDDMEELYLSRKLSATCSPTSGSFGLNNWYPVSSVVTSHGESNVEELEMLLEAYFVQIESTLNRLNTLREYIDDTEDYINIQLDNHRNQLIQLELFVSSGTICLSLYSLVAAIFGMNIPYPWKEHHGYLFKWVVMLTGLACGSLFLSIMTYARRKGLVGS